MKPIFAILPALLLASAAFAGPVYKWTDEKGRVHYSDKPVASAKKIEVNPPQADPGVVAGSSAECMQKKKQLETYQNAQNILTDDGHGAQRPLTQDELKSLIDRSKKAADAACAPAPGAATDQVPAQKSEPAARSEPLPQTQPGQ